MLKSVVNPVPRPTVQNVQRQKRAVKRNVLLKRKHVAQLLIKLVPKSAVHLVQKQTVKSVLQQLLSAKRNVQLRNNSEGLLFLILFRLFSGGEPAFAALLPSQGNGRQR